MAEVVEGHTHAGSAVCCSGTDSPPCRTYLLSTFSGLLDARIPTGLGGATTTTSRNGCFKERCWTSRPIRSLSGVDLVDGAHACRSGPWPRHAPCVVTLKYDAFGILSFLGLNRFVATEDGLSPVSNRRFGLGYCTGAAGEIQLFPCLLFASWVDGSAAR